MSQGLKSGKGPSLTRLGPRSAWSSPGGPDSQIIVSPHPPREQIPDFPPVQLPREDESEEDDEEGDDDEDEDEEESDSNNIVDMDHHGHQGVNKRRKY